MRFYFSGENLLLAYESYKVKKKFECAHLAFCFEVAWIIFSSRDLNAKINRKEERSFPSAVA